MFNTDVQQLHSWARLSWSRNKRRRLVIHKCLPGFPVKTSKLTVGSALRWRRCDGFYIDLRFPFQGRALDGSSMVQRPALAVDCHCPCAVLFSWKYQYFFPIVLFVCLCRFSWSIWPWKEQLMLFLHRLTIICICWTQFKLSNQCSNRCYMSRIVASLQWEN